MDIQNHMILKENVFLKSIQGFGIANADSHFTETKLIYRTVYKPGYQGNNLLQE